MTYVAPSNASTPVVYAPPPTDGGEGAVRLVCTPPSGSLFPIGTTFVECRATDSLDRSGACAFPITVFAPATLTRTRFMAFGDSITAGEVTVPVVTPSGLFTREVQVLSAAYPTVLQQLLRARYPNQSESILVYNNGKGAEAAEFALQRFLDTYNLENPTAVLLMEGYNDICCGNGIVGVEKAAAAVGEMAYRARLRGARVFIATLAPAKPGFRANHPDMINLVNLRYRALAQAEGAVLVDVYSALLPDVEHNLGIDGLHPTEIGYRRIAEAFYASITRELQIP
jgi:lysophospholipase L1-like esterase